MSKLMRCPFCGLLQDEPAGVKTCSRCGGGLEYESQPPSGQSSTYMRVQMELDQVAAPSGQNVERHLLITIGAPAKVPDEEIAPAGKPRPSVNFTSVLDTSGSMYGQKILHAKESVRQAVRYLHPQDAFSLVTFSDNVACPVPPGSVDERMRANVDSILAGLAPGGSTALCAGLERGIGNALQEMKETNLVLLLSDGQANVGETDLEKIGQRAQKARQQGTLVSTLGVGADYNEALMVEVATQGGGRFYHVLDAGKIPAYVAGELGEVANLAARDVSVRLTVPEDVTLVPLSAAYPVSQSGGEAVVTVGDIPCDTDLELPVRLALLAQNPGARLSLEGKLEFKSPAGNALSAPINRVTVRFMERDSFQLREGLIAPVAEKVFVQMRASSILGISRIRATQPTQAQQQSERILGNLREYADLLGKERSDREINELRAEFNAMAASPVSAKASASLAFQSMRSSKDFDKK
jgi:Mg-chelatase subunit ChlD